MAYCLKADLLEKVDESILIQLTDDDGLGVVADDVVTKAIEDADAEIDGYCGKRYSVPFSTVPGMIKKLSQDIALYNLFQRRSGATEEKKRDYENAIRFLRDVSKGAVSLGADDPDGVPAQSETPQISSSTRVFSRDNLKGW